MSDERRRAKPDHTSAARSNRLYSTSHQQIYRGDYDDRESKFKTVFRRIIFVIVAIIMLTLVIDLAGGIGIFGD